MIGVYYFEKKDWKKSLCCYFKALYARSLKLGQDSMGASDCHYNIAIVYKKLRIPDKSLNHFDKALRIRTLNKGAVSLTVSNVLEQLGKLFIETSQYKEAQEYLNQCLQIRKRLLFPDKQLHQH